MKKLALTLVVSSMLSVTGCTTVKEIFGKDTTGTHAVHAKVDNKAPVTSLNGVLVDATKQMTLYTYDKDGRNQSNCNAVCLAAWPAFLAPSAQSSGKFATIQREDGKYQWTLDGKPLYFYALDTKAGDKKGDEVMKVWHVIPAN